MVREVRALSVGALSAFLSGENSFARSTSRAFAESASGKTSKMKSSSLMPATAPGAPVASMHGICLRATWWNSCGTHSTTARRRNATEKTWLQMLAALNASTPSGVIECAVSGGSSEYSTTKSRVLGPSRGVASTPTASLGDALGMTLFEISTPVAIAKPTNAGSATLTRQLSTENVWTWVTPRRSMSARQPSRSRAS
eukprot:Amastigsp_a176405_19.p2 type:complete len:198 gc:universal Amastigsp_a176405_19:943-350(-)